MGQQHVAQSDFPELNSTCEEEQPDTETERAVRDDNRDPAIGAGTDAERVGWRGVRFQGPRGKMGVFESLRSLRIHMFDTQNEDIFMRCVLVLICSMCLSPLALNNFTVRTSSAYRTLTLSLRRYSAAAQRTP